jgi:hypothetical protein
MGLYERKYGTEWADLDRKEATERAYALGVAESLEEYNREEFEAIRGDMENAYDRSLVELAFREGKNEGRDAQAPAADSDEAAVWSDLVENVDVDIDEEETPTGGRDGIPEALDTLDIVEKMNPAEIESTDRPDFLER